MTFNIWLGGVQVNFDQVIAAIRLANPDLVAIQEAEGSIGRLARALGWSHFSERLQVVSRYPLIEPPDSETTYCFVEIAPGRIVAVANVHLPADDYGPEALADGWDEAAVVASEQKIRLSALAPILSLLKPLIARGIPTFLMGDFNSPSHLDSHRGQTTETGIGWPVCKAIEDAELWDSYRRTHTDLDRSLGVTWPTSKAPKELNPYRTSERIDFIFAGGPCTPSTSYIVGELDGLDVDLGLSPWPSDHRAVISTFSVDSAIMPVLVAPIQRSIQHGDDVTIRFNAPGADGERIVIRSADGSNDEQAAVSSYEVRQLGTIAFGTGLLAPGKYAAALVTAEGTELAASEFWVTPVGATAQVACEKVLYTPTESIIVRWHYAPGNRWDWIGIYRASEKDLTHYLAYKYTSATIDGVCTFDSTLFGGPLEAGRYEARLLRDDGYVVLAATPFSVEAMAASAE